MNMNNVIMLPLNPTEAEELLRLIDLGVKAGGLNVAINAGFFLQKIRNLQTEAANTPQPCTTSPS